MRFFASDHHFGHTNILKFVNYDGSPVREFNSIDEMNEHMIDRHNAVVNPKDSVYFGGDFVMNRRFLHLASRLNGRKTLCMGNHDVFDYEDYIKAGFVNLIAFRKFDHFVLTHIPVHVDSLNRWGMNVHGHLHNNEVKIMHGDKATNKPDLRYFNISMERINFTPISEEEINAIIKDRFGPTFRTPERDRPTS